MCGVNYLLTAALTIIFRHLNALMILVNYCTAISSKYSTKYSLYYNTFVATLMPITVLAVPGANSRPIENSHRE